jgi:hypothetical protein
MKIEDIKNYIQGNLKMFQATYGSIPEEEQEIITEETSKNKRVSDYDSVNAIVNAINARNLR